LADKIKILLKFLSKGLRYMRENKGSSSMTLGICLGMSWGLLFNNLLLGITLGAAFGISGVFDGKKKKQ
jgi:uncharacterized membrane protein